MRWYRLTPDERHALRAPAEIDGLGMLMLTLFDRWQRDAVFVLVNAFVDEAGTGGEKRLMLAALIQKAHKWHRFNGRWSKLLDKEEIPYFHLSSMLHKERPFEDWGPQRTRAFCEKAIPFVTDDIAFGVTVAVDHKVFKDEYRDKLHPSAHRDSAYGICARILMETTALLSKQFWGRDTVVNFVFETSDHFGEVLRVFNDAKRHIAELTPHLGKVAPGDKDEFCGLQAADLHASIGRRFEHPPHGRKIEQQFKTLREAREAADGCPMFHYILDEKRLPEIREQSEMISKEKKWEHRRKGFERRKARENG